MAVLIIFAVIFQTVINFIMLSVGGQGQLTDETATRLADVTSHVVTHDDRHSWRRSIVVKTLVLAGELSLSCARLMDGRVTTLWVKHPLSVSQQGQLSLPSLQGQLNLGTADWGCLAGRCASLCLQVARGG